MEKDNVIFITMDAVRPDRLSCYGYEGIETEGIDEIAEEGVLFKNCIAPSCLTPVSHASILSGKNPDKTKVRDPFDTVKTTLVSEILKEEGYDTAAFVGIDLIDSKHRFDKGFDHFDEPSEEDSFHQMSFKGKDKKLQATLGSWWVDRMFDWLEDHKEGPFFVWGHYFHVHFLAEKELLFSGEIDKDEHYKYAYYDAKIKYMDEKLFQPLVKLLKDLEIWEDTTIVVTSDHGETLGTDDPTWKTYFFDYPQHKTMYDDDLKIPLIIKDKKLDTQEINHTVRAIDIVPTLLNLLDISTEENFDGISLVPLFEKEDLPELTAYAEELFENRGAGSIQTVRTPEYKLIRNVTEGEEEFYNLKSDLEENNNLIDTTDPSLKKVIEEFGDFLEEKYESYEKGAGKNEKKTIEKQRIRDAAKKIDI
ncbi:MAG: sulfatase [Thermoplasmatota archaeon]